MSRITRIMAVLSEGDRSAMAKSAIAAIPVTKTYSDSQVRISSQSSDNQRIIAGGVSSQTKDVWDSLLIPAWSALIRKVNENPQVYLAGPARILANLANLVTRVDDGISKHGLTLRSVEMVGSAARKIPMRSLHPDMQRVAMAVSVASEDLLRRAAADKRALKRLNPSAGRRAVSYVLGALRRSVGL